MSSTKTGFWRNVLPIFATLPLVIAVSTSAQVLTLNEVEITESDLANYAQEMLKPEVRESGLARPNVVLQMIENLYVLNRAAVEGQKLSLNNADFIEWYEVYAGIRKNSEAFIRATTEEQKSQAELELMAREFYLAHPEQFTKSEAVNVDHILIDPSLLSWDQLVSRVANIRARLSDGSDFRDLAAEFSDDPSAEMNRGSLGFVERGKTDPAFETAAFAMSVPGQISEPIVPSFGVHIIRFNSYQAPGKAEFEEMRVILRERMRKEAASAAKRSALEEFREELSPYLADIDQKAILEVITPIVLQ